MNAERDIVRNRVAHDRIGAAYDERHPEIFNVIEQGRLRTALRRAFGDVRTGARPPRALDVGAGTGNLSSHLVTLGADVTAADVSAELLAVLNERLPAVETLVVNGRDLGAFDDDEFDFTATYSVLHHIPDYAALVAEMARVTRPGGVIYIDHERTDESWTSEAYWVFPRTAVVWPRRRWWYFLQPARYWKRLAPLLEWRRWFNARWMPEGDLHVWPDDHVEWRRVESALTAGGCEIVRHEDYLLYEPRYTRETWAEWGTHTTDTRLLVARKR